MNNDPMSGGVVLDQLVGMSSHTSQPAPAQQPPPGRYIRIKLPDNMSEEIAKMAWTIGMSTVQHINRGMLVMAYPQTTQNEQGQEVRSVMQHLMLLTRPEDVARLIEVATVINTHNKKILEAQNGSPTDVMSATLAATRAKDDAVAKAKGGAGIEIARR